MTRLPKATSRALRRPLMPAEMLPHLVAAGAMLALMLLLAPLPAAALGSSDSDSNADTSYSAPVAKSKAMRAATKAINQQDYEQALRHLATETAASPSNADAWNLTGFAARKLGRYEMAGTAYDKALTLNPKHKGALEYKGELHLALGQLPEAEALLARLKTMCSFNCHEVKALTKAIIAYKKAN